MVDRSSKSSTFLKPVLIKSRGQRKKPRSYNPLVSSEDASFSSGTKWRLFFNASPVSTLISTPNEMVKRMDVAVVPNSSQRVRSRAASKMTVVVR